MIHFFGDNTTSEVTKTKIIHFMEGFRMYSVNERPTSGLHKAVTEASYCLFDKEPPTSCYVCKILAKKAELNKKYAKKVS